MKRKTPEKQRELFMQEGQLDLLDASAEQRALVRKLSAEERTVPMFDAGRK